VANYFWVGGTGTWDATATTNWSLSSGGVGGAGVPTSTDNAYFDGSSDTGAPFTVTIVNGAVCADIIVGDGSTISPLDQNMTLAGTGLLIINGSLYFPPTNLTRTATGVSRFAALSGSHIITTNGVVLSNVEIGTINVQSDATFVLGSALSTGSLALRVHAGTFDTDGYNVSVNLFELRAQATKTVLLKSSTISLSASFQFVVGGTALNSTLDAGTSTLNLSSNSVVGVRLAGPFVFYDVNFTGITTGNIDLAGGNSYNNLSIASRSADGVKRINLFGNQTVNGTLILGSANTATRRISVRSDTVGIQRTITVNGTLGALSDVDFKDIAVAGTVSTPLAGTRIGDCGGNANVTFNASKTVYRVGTGNWSAAQWSLSSGGSVDADNFPLAQDAMVFDANTTSGTHTINTLWDLGTLDCSAVTSAVTIASGTQTPTFYGNITLDSDITLTGTGILTLAGQGSTQTITSSGTTFPQPLVIESPSGTVLLSDNLTVTNTVTLAQGELDVNDQTLTANVFSSSNSDTRSIDFGTGKIVLKGTGTVWTTATITGLTIAGTPVVDVDNNTATATTVTTGALSETNAISFNYISGTYTLTDANSVYRNLDFTGFAGIVPNSIRTLFGGLTLEGGATNSAGGNATTFAATSGTHQITTDGVTVDYPLVFNGNGGTFEFQDALTQGSTRAFTITNGTVELLAGATSTVGSFSTTGVDQKVLQSTTPGVQATLSQASGTVDVSYLTIRDINATGGATWNAFTSSGNVDDGNNTGWDFSSQIGKYIYTRRKNKRILP
jgi:hypothetical protein